MIELSLDMQILHSAGSWTLSEAVDSLKEDKLTRLLENTDEEISEQVILFQRNIEYGKVPTMGQVWAARFVAATEALDEEYYAEDSTMTARQYGGRKAAINRLVFRKNLTF